MKAFKHTLMIAGLLAIGSNAFAGNWPPKGSELEKACIAYGNAVVGKLYPIPGQPPVNATNETNAVLKTALSYSEDELKKVNANMDAIIAIDPAKKDSLENIAYFICTTELRAEEIQTMRQGLLDPKSVTEPSGAK